MEAKANGFYSEAENDSLFTNISVLKAKVGDNIRYLRKIATIANLRYYKSQEYLAALKKLSKQKQWGINFKGDQIVITEDNVDDVLTILQNKRLHSELTQEDFDVESVRKLT